ncbi:hypothetical protein AAG906_030665 [Vitis piasezkii]
MFKLGIFQCIGRSLCKMCYAACETYWHALKYITCFLWYKLKNTKRVNRRRRRERFKDFELGHYSSDTSESSNNYQSLSFSRKRKSFKMRGNDHDHDHVHPTTTITIIITTWSRRQEKCLFMSSEDPERQGAQDNFKGRR